MTTSDSYEKRPYRPERLPQAAERSLSEGSLRAALDVVRSVHETGEATGFADGPSHGRRQPMSVGNLTK